MVESIFARDYPVIQSLTLVLAVLVSLAFLVTDVVQMWLDPREWAVEILVQAGPARLRHRLRSSCWMMLAFAARAPDWFTPYDPLEFDYDALVRTALGRASGSAPTSSAATS